MANYQVHNDDNFSFVEDKSVDFVLTDPPFNISKKTNFHTYEKNTIHSYQFDGESDDSWDTYSHEDFLVKLDEWSAEWARVLKKGGTFAIFCADSYISHLMEALKNNGLQPRRLLIWRKNNAVPVNRAYMPMSANEYIITGVKKGKSSFNADVKITNQTIDEKIIESTIVADKASTIVYSKLKKAILDAQDNDATTEDHLSRINELVLQTLEESKNDVTKKVREMYKQDKTDTTYLQACVPNYIQHPLKVGSRIHPTEKPVALLQFLISLYSQPGDTVLDGFGGSGSTGEAALLLNRDVILVEIEKTFFGKLSERLQRISDQQRTLP